MIMSYEIYKKYLLIKISLNILSIIKGLIVIILIFDDDKLNAFSTSSCVTAHILHYSSIYLTIASIFEGVPGEVWIRGFTHSDSPKSVSKG